MTRQERLDRLLKQGMDGYDAPPYYPSGSPYMDDFTLGEEPPPPARMPPTTKQIITFAAIALAGLWLTSR